MDMSNQHLHQGETLEQKQRAALQEGSDQLSAVAIGALADAFNASNSADARADATNMQWHALLPAFGPLNAAADWNAITWAAKAHADQRGEADASSTVNKYPLAQSLQAIMDGATTGSKNPEWGLRMTQQVLHEQVAPARAAKRHRDDSNTSGGISPQQSISELYGGEDLVDSLSHHDALQTSGPSRESPFGLLLGDPNMGNTGDMPITGNMAALSDMLNQVGTFSTLSEHKDEHKETKEDKEAVKEAKRRERQDRKDEQIRKALDSDSFKNRKGNWRKYGQKRLDGNRIRSYYRCNFPGCPVKRQVVCTNENGKTSFSGMRTKGEHDHETLETVHTAQTTAELLMLDMQIGPPSTELKKPRLPSLEAVGKMPSHTHQGSHATPSVSMGTVSEQYSRCTASPSDDYKEFSVSTINTVNSSVASGIASSDEIPSIDVDYLNKVGSMLPSFVMLDPQQAGCPIVFVSPGFPALTGYQSDEVLGQSYNILQGDDTNPDSVNTIQEAVNQKQQKTVVVLNYKKSGDKFLNLLDVTPVTDAAGAVVALFVTQQDITKANTAGGPAPLLPLAMHLEV